MVMKNDRFMGPQRRETVLLFDLTGPTERLGPKNLTVKIVEFSLLEYNRS